MVTASDSRIRVSRVNRQRRKIHSRRLSREFGRPQRILSVEPRSYGVELSDALDYAESLTDNRDAEALRIIARF